jgi:uncharacterized membrane protein (DUF2068 family)
VLNFIGAGFCFLTALGALIGGSVFMAAAGLRDQLGNMLWMIGGGCLVSSAVAMVLGIGLWKLLNWARILQIAFLVLFVAFEMFATAGAMLHFNPGRVVFRLLVMAVEAWALLYLLKASVKQAFGKRIEQPRSV